MSSSDQENTSYETKNRINIKLIEKIDDEYFINKAGGWGRMQFIWLIFSLLAYQGPNFYAYNLSMLELVPRLLCRDEEGQLHECGTTLIDP